MDTRTIRLAALVLAGFISDARAVSPKVPAPAPADASQNACEREMLRASRDHNIPINVLYAVSLTETGRGGKLDPFAINVEGKAAFSRTRAEAMDKVARARAQGAKLIDIGCMQINHHFHGAKFGSLADMFEPARNVDYGARFLIELKQREGSWTKAVARYHAGPGNLPAQKTYVCSVIRNMVASGLGSWTDNAKSFCMTMEFREH
jgi:soluble lytic murein transglycosylase-like protein